MIRLQPMTSILKIVIIKNTDEKYWFIITLEEIIMNYFKMGQGGHVFKNICLTDQGVGI